MTISRTMAKKTLVAWTCTAILLFSFFGVTSSTSAAASLQATTTRYVAANGTDAGTCTSPAAPCRTIQYAVNQSVTGDRILVAQGTYTYNAGVDPCTFLLTRAVVCLLDKRLTILGGFSTSNWSTANPAANLTVIDGQNSVRGVAIVGFNTSTTFLNMEGFTIRNGRAQGPLYAGVSGGRGGGMWAVTSSVTLRDMIFRNNQAIGDNTSGAGGSADGGGLSIDSSPAGTSSLLQRVTFDGNQSLGGVGPQRGGVAFGALFVFASSVTVEDSTFTNNIARAGNSTGSGTSAGLNADALGGAIALEQGSATLSRIVASNNQVVGGNSSTTGGGAFGGAIFVEDVAAFTLNDSTISNNTTQAGNAATGGYGAGGGVLIFNSPATIDRVQLIANSVVGGSTTGGGGAGPAGGGGLLLWRSRTNVNPAVSVTNAIIADNSVALGSGAVPGGGGGGVQVQGLTATLTHTTIARNRLGPNLISGQGLLVLAAPGVSGSTANVNHSIIANHTEGGANAVAVLVQQGNTVNFNRGLFAGNNRNSNAGDGTAGTFNGLASMISAGSVQFVSPGSPNFNYHLQANSPARDQATGSSVGVDIDGQGRPENGISDLGADEYWSNVVVLARDTTGVFRPSNGIIFLKNSHSSGFADVGLNYGIPGDYPVVGDWNGDGTATIGVYRNGTFYLRNSNTIGFADIVFPFGAPGDQPIAGDWNGDGVDTIGVYRPSNGQFFLRNSNNTGNADISFFLGNVGDVGIAGDWNGDGKDTTGVFRPVNGIIFLKNTNTTGFADIGLNYGIPGDRPITGDWNNDGVDTIGVYRNGRFFLRNSNTIGFADIVFDLGNPGDMPIAGDWDGAP